MQAGKVAVFHDEGLFFLFFYWVETICRHKTADNASLTPVTTAETSRNHRTALDPTDKLTQTASFAFRLEQAQDVTFTKRPLDVADDGTVALIHEFNTNLTHRDDQ